MLFALVVWLVTLAKVPAGWRNRRDPLARAFWLTLVSVAVVVTLVQDRVYLWLGDVTGLPNLGIPAATVAGVSAGFWCQTFLHHALEGASDRRRSVPALVMALVVVLCYPFGAGTHANTADMVNTPPQTWGELVMGLCLATWTVYAVTDVGLVCRRFARTAERKALRSGMWTAAAGCPLIGAWVVVEYGPYALWSWRHTSQQPWEHTAVAALNLVGLVGFALVAVGLALPALTDRVEATLAWVRALVEYRRLGRLWRAVRPAVPAFDWPSYRLPVLNRLPLVDVHGRRYRRVVEIQDGFFALQPYRDAGYERYLQAPDDRSRTARARLEGLAVLHAVPRFQERLRPAEAAPTDPEARDLLDDVDFLVLVSHLLPRGAAADRSGVDRGVVAVQPLE